MQSNLSHFIDAVAGIFALKPAAFWEPANREAAFEELSRIGRPYSQHTYRGRRVVNPSYSDEPITIPSELESPLLIEWLQLQMLARKTPVASPESSPMPAVPMRRTDTLPSWMKREAAVAECMLHKTTLNCGLRYTRNNRGNYSSFAPPCSCHLLMEEEEDWYNRFELDSELSEVHPCIERVASLLEVRAYFLQRQGCAKEEEPTYTDALARLTSLVADRIAGTAEPPPPWVVEIVYPGATSHN